MRGEEQSREEGEMAQKKLWGYFVLKNTAILETGQAWKNDVRY